MLALIDESTFEDERGMYYVIACALVIDADHLEDPNCQDLRLQLDQILGGRRRPFRWKQEGHSKKSDLIELIGTTNVFAIGAVSQPTPPKLQRASRSTCLLLLCQQLALEGADEVLIESRRGQDIDDIATIQAGISSLALPTEFPTPQFGGKDEQLLWLPDAVAGAIREAESGKSAAWVDRLSSDGVLLDILRP